MRRDPIHWRAFYRGDEERVRLARRFSLSDRIRYYWPRAEVQAALDRLLSNLEAHPMPVPLLSQYLPGPCRIVRERGITPHPRDAIALHVREVIELYVRACLPDPPILRERAMPLS
jgi:D-tagatose-1,6-bisphosphate aldolase subunit GatZ/KbaZ